MLQDYSLYLVNQVKLGNSHKRIVLQGITDKILVNDTINGPLWLTDWLFPETFFMYLTLDASALYLT
jgi:hypothetical protein